MVRSPSISIYRRGGEGGIYYAQVNRGVAFSLGTREEKEATLWRDAKLAELRRMALGIDQHFAPAPVALTIEDGWKRYSALKVFKAKASRTREHEESCHGMFLAWCKENSILLMDQVAPSVIKAYRRSLQTKEKRGGGYLGEESVNNYVRDAGHCFQSLVDEEIYAGVNPFRSVSKLKVPRKEPKSRDWAEVQEVVAEAKRHGRDIHLVFILGMYLGIRRSEILRVRWEHINWKQGGSITIHKSKPRVMTYQVNLYPDVLEALLPYRQPSGYIVKPDHEAWPEGVRYRWDYRSQLKTVFTRLNKDREAEKRIEYFSSHQLRHTLITRLRAVGWELKDIAAFVCQSEISVTEKYGESGPDLRRKTLRINLKEKIG